MSAMSDIDLMLTEYEQARAQLDRAPSLDAFSLIDNTLRQADILAAGLRTILGRNP